MKTVIAVIAIGVLVHIASASPILNHPGDPFSVSRAPGTEPMRDNSSLDSLSCCAQSWVRLADQSQPPPSDAAITSARKSDSAQHDLTVCLMPDLGPATENRFGASQDGADPRPQTTSLFANSIEPSSGTSFRSATR